MEPISKTLKNWWMLLVLGILFVAFSVWIFLTPLTSYISLAIVFSIFVFADGIVGLIFTISNWKSLEGRGWQLANSILLLIIGFILLVYPGLSLATLPFIVGFWLMMRGVFVISSAVELRKYGGSNWGWILVSGIFLLLFSVLVILNPLFGAVYVVVFTACSFLMMGIAQIALSLMLRKMKGNVLDKIEAFTDSLRADMGTSTA
jgi:uncharacterized membrane protein HdeD (DUF308 family)